MKQTGLLAVILSFVFALVVAVLGFLQPEYSHVVNSISTLVVGPHGWVGQVNFVVLALAGLMVGS